MKIIKHGDINRPLKGECSDCGCQIECTKDEAPKMFENVEMRMIKCPGCIEGYISVS